MFQALLKKIVCDWFSVIDGCPPSWACGSPGGQWSIDVPANEACIRVSLTNALARPARPPGVPHEWAHLRPSPSQGVFPLPWLPCVFSISETPPKGGWKIFSTMKQEMSQRYPSWKHLERQHSGSVSSSLRGGVFWDKISWTIESARRRILWRTTLHEGPLLALTATGCFEVEMRKGYF